MSQKKLNPAEGEKILGAILEEIEDEKLFHAMTKRATATDFSEDTLTLAFESSFLEEHFRKNYSRRLEKVALKILGKSITVNVEE